MPKLILIDGSSYLYRAFHALPPLSNAQGEPTGALFGVVNMLRATLKANPDYLAFVSDAPGPTFRDALYDQYKANRPPMPDDLRAPGRADAGDRGRAGLPDPARARRRGRRRDRHARRAGAGARCQSGGVHQRQGHGPAGRPARVTLVNTMSNTVMDRDGVMEKFGVRPDQIIDFLALTGDAIDNIPGVPKCEPEKTAAKWLAEYATLDGVIANADQIGGKIGESLRATLPQLPLSRQLATIKTDVALDVGPTELARRDADNALLRELYTRYEFKAALKELDAVDASLPSSLRERGWGRGSGRSARVRGSTEPFPQPLSPARGLPDGRRGERGSVSGADHLAASLAAPGEYELVTTQPQLDAWLEKLRHAELIALGA
ncbi:DNA polymerase I OS=Rhodanobacter lindaniclasticus OX=75310 GN=polA PE=3 SV=1 [Rhodanobacter lindaniclasticus]